MKDTLRSHPERPRREDLLGRSSFRTITFLLGSRPQHRALQACVVLRWWRYHLQVRDWAIDARPIVVLCAMLVTGCAAAHDGSDAGAGDAPLDSVERDIASLEAAWHASCARVVSCVSQARLTGYAECHPESWTGIESRVRAGALHVDVDAATRCIEAISALPPCPYAGEQLGPAEWPEPIAGLLDDAENACRHLIMESPTYTCGGETCAPGSGCLLDENCGEHCEPPHEPGDSCGALESCGTLLGCIDGICRPECSRSACRAAGFDDCSLARGVCVNFPHVGDTCSGDCGTELHCQDGRCEPLTASGACLDNWVCGAGRYCHASSSTCVDDPLGSPCWTYGVAWHPLLPTAICPAGYTCVDARCAVALGDGEACTRHEECGLHSLCVDGTCSATVMPWEPCGPGVACPLWFGCIEGRCTNMTGASVGSLCRTGGACDQGVCIQGYCSWRQPGERCQTGECPSCVDGICSSYAGSPGTECHDPAMCAQGLLCFGAVGGTFRCCPG